MENTLHPWPTCTTPRLGALHPLVQTDHGVDYAVTDQLALNMLLEQVCAHGTVLESEPAFNAVPKLLSCESQHAAGNCEMLTKLCL